MSIQYIVASASFSVRKISPYLKMVWRSDCLTSQESPGVQENCQQIVTNSQLNEFSKPNHSKGKS